jgi:hypothetical protein
MVEIAIKFDIIKKIRGNRDFHKSENGDVSFCEILKSLYPEDRWVRLPSLNKGN